MPRIALLERPFPSAFDTQMKALMGDAEPLTLFKTLATSERAWSKFSAAGMLDRGPLPLREREIVIDRATARCGCEYEWGVHIAVFAEKAGIDAAQAYATVHGDADDPVWTAAEQALIATVDALLDRRRLSDDEWATLRAHFDEAQALEIIQLVSFYHGVALICGALDLPLEPNAARFPAAQKENPDA